MRKNPKPLCVSAAAYKVSGHRSEHALEPNPGGLGFRVSGLYVNMQSLRTVGAL